MFFIDLNEYDDLGHHTIEGPDNIYSGRALYKDKKLFFKEDGDNSIRRAEPWELDQISYED